MLLDQLSDGRTILGIGRGLGAVEFDGFRVDMTNSRGIFNESAEAIVRGYMEYNGEFIKQPRRELRPGPFKTFEGRLFGAGLSPETGPIMARRGLGMLIFPLKAWLDVRVTLDEYEKEWLKHRPGTEPTKCIQVAFCYVDKDPARAKAVATDHVANYYKSIISHYDMAGDRLKGTKGYEFYQKTVQANRTTSTERSPTSWTSCHGGPPSRSSRSSPTSTARSTTTPSSRTSPSAAWTSTWPKEHAAIRVRSAAQGQGDQDRAVRRGGASGRKGGVVASQAFDDLVGMLRSVQRAGNPTVAEIALFTIFPELVTWLPTVLQGT